MSYERMIHGKYDNELCHSTFLSLLDHPRENDLLLQAMETALPVLGRVLGTKFRSITPGTQTYEEVIDAVPFSFFLYLSSDNFYRRRDRWTNKESHFQYLWGIFRYEIINTLQQYRRAVPTDIPTHVTFPDYYLSLLPSSVDLAILLEQLPEVVLKDVEAYIRFRDDPDYGICLCVLESLILGNPIPWYTIKKAAPEYDSAKVKFLVDHVKVLFRQILLKYRPEIEKMQTNLHTDAVFSREAASQEYGYENSYGEDERWGLQFDDVIGEDTEDGTTNDSQYAQ